MRIDAHQHIWTLARGDYDWMSPALGPIYRDFAPADLSPLLEAAGIDGTVLVQAAATTAETSFLLDAAERTPFIKGVVGWINFEDPSDLATLRDFARHPKFRGVRPMIQDIADIDWMLRPDLDWAFRVLIERDMTFDLLGFPRHLPNALTLLQRYPQLRAVIDHAMKPTIAAGLSGGWADTIARLARETQAYVKLSGLVTEAGPDWTPAGLAPFVSHVLDVFGPDRVMWGSDWPVVNLASDYARWHAVTRDLVAAVSGNTALDAVFGGTAAAFYRLGV